MYQFLDGVLNLRKFVFDMPSQSIDHGSECIHSDLQAVNPLWKSSLQLGEATIDLIDLGLGFRIHIVHDSLDLRDACR